MDEKKIREATNEGGFTNEKGISRIFDGCAGMLYAGCWLRW